MSKSITVKVIIDSDISPVIPSILSLGSPLSGISLELYCLCTPEDDYRQVMKLCEQLKSSKILTRFSIFTQRDFSSWMVLANAILTDLSDASYTLFLSSNVLCEKNTLDYMINRLKSYNQIAGVNPLLLADWFSGEEKRVAFMGLAFDFQKKLHYLYEGILSDNALVRNERFFQIGHPGCLLIRSSDFIKAGGLKEELGFLAFPGLCLQILGFRQRGYVCLPDVQWRISYKFDSWSFCGAWDSFLQRGRLETGNIRSDYADFCLKDGIEYGCDNWLVEGPAQVPDMSEISSERHWQNWRYHPEPATLVAFLASLPAGERGMGIELARNRPASLPQTL